MSTLLTLAIGICLGFAGGVFSTFAFTSPPRR